MKDVFCNSPTLADVIRAHPSQTTGFEYLRIGLSVAILVEHALGVAIPGLVDAIPPSWFGPIHRAELGMFFALSGFLVAGSLLRNSLPHFLALRVLRIAPALAVEVGLTAVVIGAFFTTLPLSEYFQTPMFWNYFRNIVGDMHYNLPGVFNGEIINYQLWTIPVEFECYLTLAVASVVGLVLNRKLFGVIVMSVAFSLTVFAVRAHAVNTGPVMPNWALVLSFLCGVFGFLFKEKIPYDRRLGLAGAAAAYALLVSPNLVFLAPAPIAYLTVYVGLMRLPHPPLADLSYGIYLYHFPILQSIYHLSNDTMRPATLVALTLLTTGLLASLSWFGIEKPILNRKYLLLGAIDRVWGTLAPASRKSA